MDFEVTDDLAEYRAAATAWIAENVDKDWAKTQKYTGQNHTPALHRLLAEQGWYAAGWPAEYGGNDRDPDATRALFQELVKVGIKHDGWSTTSLVLNILLQLGTEDQKQNYIPAGLRGEVIIALGYTEPGCGSDVAAVTTKAVAEDSHWLINGQKMFTSTADHASHVFVLARTNPQARKHNGLSLFMVPTADRGFEWHPVQTLGGQQTTATFFTDIRVPDSARVGQVDGGWDVMRLAALPLERGGGVGPRPPSGTSGNMGSQRDLQTRVVRWARETARPDGSRVWDDPTVRQRMARIAIESEVSKLLWMRPTWVSATGGIPETEGSAAKLFMTEVQQRHHQAMLDILGSEGVLSRQNEHAPIAAAVEEAFRYAVVGTVYGGSSEIMREIIAQRQLGLPRVRGK
jgi:alkylation response protein AidB-like acyl-CoA dehydrogenase